MHHGHISKASYGTAAIGAQSGVSPKGHPEAAPGEISVTYGKFGKRSGEPSGDTPVEKATQLLPGPGSVLPGGADASDAGGPGIVAPASLFDPTRPPSGELLLLTGPQGEEPAAIRAQRPKVTTKKKLTSRRACSLPAIQLPLGEWPHNPPVSRHGNDTSGAPGLSTVPLGATPGGSLELCRLEAAIRLGEASNRALQASLEDLRHAAEVTAKVSGPRSSPCSPRASSKFFRNVLEVLVLISVDSYDPRDGIGPSIPGAGASSCGGGGAGGSLAEISCGRLL